ncbi:glycosyltransferase [Pseudomonas juntendi]|uniref:Glycosyltransferase n=1 Tax=Pseudomonas juntendi TaxID=2666183 RepID=A0ABD4YH67_9PSED|nr:glycosyltransferase [Pseudomonas juntendi]MDH0758670.1 glycosyltransferase [Pseudomonas juntendi]MDH1920504.1 glycosyltransferase [Pseudomonas juntendi]
MKADHCLRMPFPFRYFEANGYGAVTRGLVGGLVRLGVDIRIPNNDYSRFAARSGLLLTADESNIWEEIRSKPDDLSITTSLQISVPHVFESVGGIEYLYTMTERSNWAERYASKNWLEKLNSPNLNIITPTQWNKSVFITGGVTNPVHVSPCGIDREKLIAYSQTCASEKASKFTFFSVFNGLGNSSSRENWKFLQQALEVAFEHDSSVEWLVKTNELPLGYVSSSKINMRVIADPHLSESQMVQLYMGSHAFLKNSVEGWSMPTMEAMSLRVPVIHSYNTAPTEYLNNSNSLIYSPDDLSKLVEHLKFIRSNYNSDCISKIVRAAETTAKAYCWETASIQLRNVLFPN